MRLPRPLVWIWGSALVVLVLTGFWLTRYYRPSPMRIYAFGDAQGVTRSIRIANAMRQSHNGAALTFLGASLVGAYFVLRGASSIARRIVAAVAGLVAAVGGIASGVGLGWDQLALKAITVNSAMRGAWGAAFSDNVRFVIIASSEVAQSTYRNTLLLHLLVPAALAVVVLVTVRRVTPPSPPAQPGAPSR